MKKVIFAVLMTALLPILTFCGTSGNSADGIDCSSEIRADDPVIIRFPAPPEFLIPMHIRRLSSMAAVSGSKIWRRSFTASFPIFSQI